MKKCFQIVAAIVVVATFAACKSSSSPSNVAEKFAHAMIKNDFTTAEKLATKESAQLLKENEEMSKNNPLPDSIKNVMEKASIKILNEKIENDTLASISLQTIFPKEIMGKKETTETLMLKKEEGKWRIDIMETMKRIMMGGMNMPEMNGDIDLDSSTEAHDTLAH